MGTESGSLSQGLKCASCGAPYHEATGHRFTDTMVICGACARHFIKFIKFQMSRRTSGGLKLSEAAVTSVKPPKEEE